MKLIYLYWFLGIFILVVAVMVIMLITSIKSYAMYWDKQAARTDQVNPLTYVALGDSAAQGIGALSPTNGYVGLIATKLADQKNRPIHVINLSKTGAKIGDVLETQIPKLNQLKPDVVTLEIGANDIKTFNAVMFEKQVKELLDLMPENSYISDLPYFGGRSRFIDPVQERNVISANKILHAAASKKNLRLVELHQQTFERNQYFWVYAIDYFHPNSIGYRAWADAFWENIK